VGIVELRVESIYNLMPLKMAQCELTLKYTFRNNGCHHSEPLHRAQAVRSQADTMAITCIGYTFTLSPNYLRAQCVNVEPFNVSLWFQTFDLRNSKLL